MSNRGFVKPYVPIGLSSQIRDSSSNIRTFDKPESIFEINFLCLNYRPIKHLNLGSFVRNPVIKGKLPPISTRPHFNFLEQCNPRRRSTLQSWQVSLRAPWHVISL